MLEFDLIRHLCATLPGNTATVVGPGDDCAVIDVGIPDRWLLFKTDAVVQNIHFTSEAPPEQVGHKALGRCLSDIAAMGGKPLSALVTLGLPPNQDVDWITAVYRGMTALAERYQVAIVGGETTTNPAGVSISMALIGTIEKNKAVLRSGAKHGDAIFVTGSLGGSILGKHLDFEPRLAEASWLVRNFEIHSMIDLSDGLAGDLRHILDASKVGAELLTPAIPISREAKRVSASGKKSPLDAALTDGEDFELLFTLKSADAVPLLDSWRKQFPSVPLACIGKITANPGLILKNRDQIRQVTEKGYEHFA